ncbi:MAG TPA: flagellar basal body L-ring protein FlgH [Anaeromyxobacter sp.]|nr:flagellar basal body L-ring protein FlgH [Anaeromyxobacter sp.]
MSRAPLALSLALGLCACAGPGVDHVAKYQPKNRDYPAPEASARATGETTPGSLWQDANAGALFTDARAFREHDLVVIKIEEIADAKRSSDTDLSRQNDATGGMGVTSTSAANSVTKSILPTLSAQHTSDSTFKGSGSIARTERLIATVPATVKKVLPNGNLFVEGHRVVLVNNEEQHFYISGVVRPIDIDGDNSVKSSLVADAEIEFTGRGVMTENQQKGWMQKYLGWIWPF